MHEQRHIPLTDSLQYRAQGVEPLRPGERAGGDRDADAAALEQPVHLFRVRAVERYRPPGFELRTELQDAGEVSIDQFERAVTG